LGVLRRHQSHFMSQRFKAPAPMMGRGASFHRDDRWLELMYGQLELRSRQLAVVKHIAVNVDCDDLIAALCQIHSDELNLVHGGLLSYVGALTPPSLTGIRVRSEGGVHLNIHCSPDAPPPMGGCPNWTAEAFERLHDLLPHGGGKHGHLRIRLQ